jgi:hypothetical protein
MEVFSFELKLKEVTVKLDGSDYIIRELTGKQRDKYLDTVAKRVQYVNGMQAGMTSLSGLQSSLLSMCMVDEDGKNVPESTIADFPGSVTSKLFKIAQDLSGLNENEDSQEVKND